MWAWLYNRRERAWLWLFLVIAVDIAYDAFLLLSAQTTLISERTYFFWQIALGVILRLLWVMFWWEWFGLQGRRWIPRTVWLLAAAHFLTNLCGLSLFMGLNLLRQTALRWFNAGFTWWPAAEGLLLVVILVEGFRRDRTEAMLAAVPISPLFVHCFFQPTF